MRFKSPKQRAAVMAIFAKKFAERRKLSGAVPESEKSTGKLTVKKPPKPSFDNGSASSKENRNHMMSNLKTIEVGGGLQDAVGGMMNRDNARFVINNMKARLSSFTAYLAGDTVDRMHSVISRMESTLSNNSKEFSGINARDMDLMGQDFVNRLVHQEIESNRQQYTDHGIRHIQSNIETQSKILDALESQGEKFSGKEKLLSLFIMVNHDIGYTTPEVRKGGSEGVKASVKHKEFSAAILAQEKSTWDVDKIFSAQEYDRALNIVSRHDEPKLDVSDSLHLATSVADNLAMFAKEKLPSMFKYIKGSETLLVRMGGVAKTWKESNSGSTKANAQRRYSIYKKRLEHLVDGSKLNENLKRDLKAGVREINFLTPKFAMGTLAGEVTGIRASKHAMIDVSVKWNKYDAMLQRYFDMGQRQMKKLLESYGQSGVATQKEYSMGSNKGKAILRIKVV